MGKNMVEKYVEDEIILENVNKRIVDEKFKQKLLKIVENNKEKYPLVDAYENDSCNPSSVGLELAWLNTIADDIRAIKNMMVNSNDRVG